MPRGVEGHSNDGRVQGHCGPLPHATEDGDFGRPSCGCGYRSWRTS